MIQNLPEELKKIIKGDVLADEETLKTYSHDYSLFEVKSKVVVFPKDAQDLKALINYVSNNKKRDPSLSLTARAAGTDMGGGSINDSILVEFNKYFNHTPLVTGDIATTEPGVLYKDFEKETLKYNLLFPSYPASRELCAMGGILNNNSGGEKSLQYGKTERYVRKMKVILRDGNTYELKKLSETELKQKLSLNTFEGEIYQKMYKLLNDNYDAILKAKPDVSKNSAGYYLWNIYDRENKTFDLTQLWVGAQGTLGFLLEADTRLVPVHKHRDMIILFLHDLSCLNQIIKEVLSFNPESFEAYDDSTLKLALKYFPEFAKLLGTKGIIQTGISFLPEFCMIAFGGMPKLILQVDFTGDNIEELKDKVRGLQEAVKSLCKQTRVALEDQEEKYWAIRRESFNLLSHKVRNKHTAPFIDDFVVKPEFLATVLPEVIKILKKHPEFFYTIAGHVGDGNFHIIPLVDIANPNVRKNIPIIADQIYSIVNKYHGSITGEHNDGLIRTPYLKQMYGEKMIKLFEETKNIFDPDNIFNPRKKVYGDMDYAMGHIRQQW